MLFKTLVLLVAMALPSFVHAQARIERAKEAQQALLDLQFFHEGRGMITPPGLGFTGGSLSDRIVLGAAAKMLNREFGLIVRKGLPVGLHSVEYNKVQLGVLGCAICHSGKAAGVFVPGLGNKNIDIFRLSQAALGTWGAWEKLDQLRHPKEQEQRKILRDRARHFLGEIENQDLTNQTQGLVPTGIIGKWFYDQSGTPRDANVRAQVKVPFLWGYAEKRKVGSFADGFGYGVLPGWAIAVELVGGQTVEGVRAYEPKIHKAEDVLADLLPPPYPFAIDQKRAARGGAIFSQTCAKCHGTYARDADGIQIFEQPRFIPLSVIKTDAGRLGGVTPLFKKLVAESPLNDLIQYTNWGPGYIAPRLDGAWARFPYLHNGSVPTLYDLLQPAAKRPKYFSLRDAGEKSRFDAKKLGLTANEKQETLAKLAAQKKRYVYDTSMIEHGNGGHEFDFYSELTDEDRLAIIEFVKTL